MKINKYKIIAMILPSLVLLPVFVFAACNPNLGFIPCDGSAECPCNFEKITILINNIITKFLQLSSVVAAITFSIAGGKMLMNPENPGERAKAIDMFKKTVYGLIIVLSAWIIIKTVVSYFVNPDINALRYLDVAKDAAQ